VSPRRRAAEPVAAGIVSSVVAPPWWQGEAANPPLSPSRLSAAFGLMAAMAMVALPLAGRLRGRLFLAPGAPPPEQDY
jgi:hypothetical protein